MVENIDVDHCRVKSQTNPGRPDLLIELKHSAAGGWWITGALAPTLLQPVDGRHWKTTALFAQASSLVSAYVVNARESRLAAILAVDPESPFVLVYAGDGGRTWRNVLDHDAVLRQLPRGWLEGQKRRAQP